MEIRVDYREFKSLNQLIQFEISEKLLQPTGIANLARLNRKSIDRLN